MGIQCPKKHEFVKRNKKKNEKINFSVEKVEENSGQAENESIQKNQNQKKNNGENSKKRKLTRYSTLEFSNEILKKKKVQNEHFETENNGEKNEENILFDEEEEDEKDYVPLQFVD